MKFNKHTLPDGTYAPDHWVSECGYYTIMKFEYLPIRRVSRFEWYGVYLKHSGKALSKAGHITTRAEAVALAEAHKNEQEGKA